MSKARARTSTAGDGLYLISLVRVDVGRRLGRVGHGSDGSIVLLWRGGLCRDLSDLDEVKFYRPC